MEWDGMEWDGMGWNGTGWDGIGCNGAVWSCLLFPALARSHRSLRLGLHSLHSFGPRVLAPLFLTSVAPLSRPPLSLSFSLSLCLVVLVSFVRTQG